MEYLKHPFTIGLGVGLLVAVIVWISALFKRQPLSKDNRKLRDHLHTQMEITARGNSEMQKELEELKKQNENMRVTNATLSQKTGKAELRTLAVYDRALHLMYEKAPGFAPAWEGALKVAEEDIQKTDKGLMPLIRKVFRPSLTAGDSEGRQLPSGNADTVGGLKKEGALDTHSEPAA